MLVPWRVTWNPKMKVWKMSFLFKGAEVASENRPFCPKQIHLNNERSLVVEGFLGDEKLPSYVGIISRSMK